jgi:hypothetical protein
MYLYILIIVSVFILINTGIAFYRERKFKFLIVFVIALFMLLFSLFPALSRQLSEHLGLGNNLNTLIFTGFIILFLFIMRLLKTTEDLKRQISKIIEADALRNFKDKE